MVFKKVTMNGWSSSGVSAVPDPAPYLLSLMRYLLCPVRLIAAKREKILLSQYQQIASLVFSIGSEVHKCSIIIQDNIEREAMSRLLLINDALY